MVSLVASSALKNRVVRPDTGSKLVFGSPCAVFRLYLCRQWVVSARTTVVLAAAARGQGRAGKAAHFRANRSLVGRFPISIQISLAAGHGKEL